ncbi:MAG: hypothetical protein ACM37W_24795 [Actinomycetota bacterium]
MKHRFFFVPGKIKYSTFHQYYDIEPNAIFHDDIIRYIRDSLQWVPSIQVSFPHKRESYGLDEYGINIIHSTGATVFCEIITGWEKLFSQAPEVFEITSGILCDHDGRAKYPLEFRKVSVKRDFLVDNFHKLSECARQAAQGDGYILHLGM